MPFNFEVTCSDGSKIPANVRIHFIWKSWPNSFIIFLQSNNLIVNVADNKAPKFNQRNYLLSGVSKRLPTGVDLLKVYPGQIDLFIQDIDRDAQGQLQDEFQIIIQGKYNNF